MTNANISMKCTTRIIIKDNNGSQGNLAFIGPLTSNSIYPIDELPRLLQETIVNANNIFNRYMLFDPEGKFKTDLYRRRDMIEDIINGKNVLHRKESKIRRLVDLPRELKNFEIHTKSTKGRNWTCKILVLNESTFHPLMICKTVCAKC